MNNREDQRKSMFDAHEKKKELIKIRDQLLKSKKDADRQKALLITHDIAKLENFVRRTENKLRLTD